MRAVALGLLTLLLLGACSQSVPPATPTQVVATVQGVATAAATLGARFDPTAAIGGGANASGAVPPQEEEDRKRMRRFASLGLALMLAVGTLVPVANAQVRRRLASG